MSDNAAITTYQQAVSGLASGCDALKVLAALAARDSVASELETNTPTAEMIAEIAKADRDLKDLATSIIQLVGSEKLADWRDARRCNALAIGLVQSDDWWWSLDARSTGDSWKVRALNYILWGSIVVSLSFIVESVRRFLSGEVGVLGTVLAALVTLLVGSTVVEIAKQLTILRSGDAQKLQKQTLKRRTAFSVVFIVIAFVMWFLLPEAVKYYSNRGVTERRNGELSNPISSYQRTISLEPSDAIAHYNLARAYEVVSEYGKAEEEYKSAIRWDDHLTLAYDGLAHLLIAQKKDYVNALRLLNTGFTKLDAQKKANEFQSDDDYIRIKASLLGNRAWVYFGLGYLAQAEDDLREVISLRDKAAGPQCLLGQVLDEKAKLGSKSAKVDTKEIRQAYQNCIALSHEQEEKIEADWLAHAQEHIDQEDEADSRSTDNNKAPTKQRKKS